MQLGYTKGLVFRGNIIKGEKQSPVGLYIWGKSRYNDQPGENVVISDNRISAAETGISLNGAKNVRIHGNVVTAPKLLLLKRTEGLKSDVE